MVVRPLAPGRGGAGEIQRAQPPRADRRSPPSSPHWAWCAPHRHEFRRPASRCRPRVGQRAQHAADILGPDGRKVALQVDDDFHRAMRIELAQRLEDPVRPGWMLGARHDGFAAMGGTTAAISGVSVATATRPIWPPRPGAAHGRSSAGRRDRAAVCRAAAWRPCGRESARKCGFRASAKQSGRVGNRPEMMGIGRKSAPLYGLPEHGQTDISPDWVRCESLIPDAIRGRSAA